MNLEEYNESIDINQIINKLHLIAIKLKLGEYPLSRIEHIKAFADTITDTSPCDDNDYKRMKRYLVLGWYFHEALKNSDQINFDDNNGDLFEGRTHL